MAGEEKDDATPTGEEHVGPPLLRIITPDTTEEEVAAIVAVLSALGTSEEKKPTQPASEWNSPYRQVRPFYSHGPGGWRSSGLPKHRGRGN